MNNGGGFMEVKSVSIGGWKMYFKGKPERIDADKCGKWLYFFEFLNSYYAEEICETFDGLIGWK